ncbi:MAG: type II toxin-antitoxin system RelE/ParE family toxin [Pseudomonadota bacterium]
MSSSRDWEVQLADAAKADLRDIIDWTAEHFGDGQAKTYSTMISAAFRALKAGPDTVGVKVRDDLGEGMFILPVARSGKRGRHLIVFRTAPDRNTKTLQILRILHDAMDLPRHVSFNDETQH